MPLPSKTAPVIHPEDYPEHVLPITFRKNLA